MKCIGKRVWQSGCHAFFSFLSLSLGGKQCLHVMGYMVQTHLNKISQEVHEMDSSDQVAYEEKNMTVKVERVFIGEKTAKELVLELLKKRREAGEFRP